MMPTASSEVDLLRIIEGMEITSRETMDFILLGALGNFYELAAEKHKASSIARVFVIEWFEKAASTYKAALDAYRQQSDTQIPGFAERLEAHLNYVNDMKGHITPYGQSVDPSERPKLWELVGASRS